jgi:LmbE family N-acetylglucosaminyl deacetylase
MPERVLIVSPHPDDVEIFVGGTMLRHHHAGDRVEVLLCTRGDAGTKNPFLRRTGKLAAIRTRETEERFALTPGVTVRWLGWADGEVAFGSAAVDQVAELIAERDPELLYLPEFPAARAFYDHPDHMETTRIVEAAVDRVGGKRRVRYYHSNEPNLLVDVRAFEEENQRALRCYRTQYAATCDPPFLLWRREIVRALMLRRWHPLKNNRYVHGALNWLQAVFNLPVEPGTEAFREAERGDGAREGGR